jgi:ABC-type lipoprotein release transport system permease subunit
MESILFRVSPLDPVIFLLAAVAALAVAGVAAWAPARRASAVDPMVALRQE